MATAIISSAALLHNLARSRQIPFSSTGTQVKTVAVIKANAYGHGITEIAKILQPEVAMVAVSSIDEAEAVRNSDFNKPIIILRGLYTEEEIQKARTLNFIPVVHFDSQLHDLIQAKWKNQVWIKAETGMHRLGLTKDKWRQLVRLALRNNIEVVAMQHYARADQPNEPMNSMQEKNFEQYMQDISCPISCANSAAICSHARNLQTPALKTGELVRPGIMLYGSSPVTGISADSLELQPVMRLTAKVLAVKAIKRNDSVGYGATWQAPHDGNIAILGCGYGDGYPREFPNGNKEVPYVTYKNKSYPLAGRVSMDMMTIWLHKDTLPINDEVTLWGEDPHIDQLSLWANTISYTIFTRVAQRVERKYIKCQGTSD